MTVTNVAKDEEELELFIYCLQESKILQLILKNISNFL
jgi:hypothetical protein